MASIKDFDAVAKSANSYEFEFIDEHGKNSGFFITIIGAQSESVTKRHLARLNKERQTNRELIRRGKEEILKPMEEVLDDFAGDVAACIVGWRGVEEKYTPELAFQVLKNNELIYEQVKKESQNLANFTKSK